MRLGLAAEQAVLEVAEFGLEAGDLLLELLLPLGGTLVLGLVVGGLPLSVAEWLVQRTDDAGNRAIGGPGRGGRGAHELRGGGRRRTREKFNGQHTTEYAQTNAPAAGQ